MGDNDLVCDYVNDYFEMRRLNGYKLGMEKARILKFFERHNIKFVADLEPRTIVKALEQNLKLPPKSTTFFRNYISDIQKYINLIGINIPIISKFPSRKRFSYKPHIYTREEIVTILETAKTHRPCQNRKPLAPWELIYVYLILLLGTGIRPQEARLLKIRDVNFENNVLVVLDSKNHTDRVVPFHDSVKIHLIKYRDNFLKKKGPDSYFFARYDDKCLNSRWLGERFLEILLKANIKHDENGPRLYDFRHTFCTYKFYEWVLNDINVYGKLPVLSAYLGHKTLTGTEHYLHAAKEFDDFLRKKIDEMRPDIYGVKYEK